VSTLSLRGFRYSGRPNYPQPSLWHYRANIWSCHFTVQL